MVREPGFTDRLDEQPKLDLKEISHSRPRDLVVRFVAGGVTSVVAGVLTIVFGPRIGGVMLAFPAILAASLTLIEEQEDSVEAREDARGALAGGVALTAFAVVAWLLFGHVPGALVLGIACGAWAATAGGLYLVLWWRR